MNRVIFTLLFVMCIAISGYTQDPQFTQIYASPLYTCPSFAGSTSGSRVILNFRDQWPAIPGAFVTTACSFDQFIPQVNSGVGVLLLRDWAGTGRLGTFTSAIQYTYNIKAIRYVNIRPSLQFAYGQRSINFNRLLFNDQLLHDDNVSIETPSFEKVSYADFGIGLLAYSHIFWGGFSIDHITQPNISLTDGIAQLPRKFTLFGGYKYAINGKIGENSEESVTGAFLYKSQAKYDQLDIGAYWYKKPLVVGLWYRGIPLLKRYAPGYQNNDAIAIMAGYQLDKIKFAYSYDFTISRLVLNTAGSHEISIIYEFNQNIHLKRKAAIIPCPKF
ncbi:MAG: hypothetical protein Kow0068_08610 [Marinilabiliales bacterium]